MESVKPVKLWTKAYKSLLEEIRAMAPGDNQLPPEDDIAAALHISRATVREAMQALIAEGYVTRRQGKGNFAHPSALSLRNRIDLTSDFIELLSTGEERATCKFLSCGYAGADAQMALRFPAPCGQIYQQHWLFCRADKPLISCKISVPQALLVKDPQFPGPDQNLIRWLWEYCRKDIAYYATHLLCGADAEAAWVLRLPGERSMLNWHEVLYDIYDEPVAFCNLFFHPDDVDLSMILRL